MQLLRREHVPGPSRDSFKNARDSRLRACEVLAAGISRECEVDPHLDTRFLSLQTHAVNSTRKSLRWPALFSILLVPLLFGWASSLQYPAFPDQTKRVEDPAKARIYLIRPARFWG